MASKQAIEMRGNGEFSLSARGCDYTLKRENDRWAMYVVNAAVRAWNRGFAIPKYFDSLEAVEAKYKAWAGISNLAAAPYPVQPSSTEPSWQN